MLVFNAQPGQQELHLPQALLVDNFAGGGGASTGFELATGRPVDIAINHNMEALSMHSINHPHTDHYCESVWDVDPIKVCKGRPVEAAWFSPDCKYFSKAKGGQPIDSKIRGLAWVKLRWLSKKKPIVNFLENVEEFKKWGPVNKEGKAIKEREGETFDGFMKAITTGLKPNHPSWREAITELGIQYDIKEKYKLFKGFGYRAEWRELRASDYGAPTIRKRFFLVSRCDDLPIEWPAITHGNPSLEASKQGNLTPWKPASDIIDFSIPCKSIFGRNRPLAEKTLQRIAKGIKRYVIDCDDPFIIPNHECAPFITEHANGSSQRNMPANEPLRTICAQVKGGHFAVVQAFLKKASELDAANDDCKPNTTNNREGEETLTTSSLVTLRNNNFGNSLDNPIPTITAGGQHVGEVRAFLVKYYGSEKDGCDINHPLHTVPTKDRFGLVTVRGVNYQIVDIAMRMLTPKELYAAQSFPENFIHDRTLDNPKLTVKAQVRMCGNSVPPELAAALIKANLPSLRAAKDIAA